MTEQQECSRCHEKMNPLGIPKYGDDGCRTLALMVQREIGGPAGYVRTVLDRTAYVT